MMFKTKNRFKYTGSQRIYDLPIMAEKVYDASQLDVSGQPAIPKVVP